MACKGICTRYKAQKAMWESGRYASGQRRCQICKMFIEWDGLWCPCCGYRLKSKPRSSKDKARLRQSASEIHSMGHELHPHRLFFMNSKIKVIIHALMSRIGVVTKSGKNLVNIRVSLLIF